MTFLFNNTLKTSFKAAFFLILILNSSFCAATLSEVQEATAEDIFLDFFGHLTSRDIDSAEQQEFKLRSLLDANEKEIQVNRGLFELVDFFSQVKIHTNPPESARGVPVRVEILKSYLLDFLKTLPADAHILNAGSGNSVMSMQMTDPSKCVAPARAPQLLKDAFFPIYQEITKIAQRFKLTDITFKIDPKILAELKDHPQIQILSDRYFADVPEKEILKHKAEDQAGESEALDAIIDIYGVLTYTQSLSEDLNKFLRMLKTDGKIMLVTHPYMESSQPLLKRNSPTHGIIPSTEILHDDKVMSFWDWISAPGSSRGIEVERVTHTVSGGRAFHLIITKKDPTAQVGALTLVEPLPIYTEFDETLLSDRFNFLGQNAQYYIEIAYLSLQTENPEIIHWPKHKQDALKGKILKLFKHKLFDYLNGSSSRVVFDFLDDLDINNTLMEIIFFDGQQTELIRTSILDRRFHL